MKLDEILKEVDESKPHPKSGFDVMVQKEDKVYMIDDVIVKRENNTIYLIIE